MALAHAEASEPDERPELLHSCYDDIRRMAQTLLRADQTGLLLQPTELAHEAAIRMLKARSLDVHDRGQMLALAARIMRQSLIDELRRAFSAKRRPPRIETAWPDADATPIALDVLDDALTQLAKVSAEHAEIVELRFSLGMTVEQVASATGLGTRTVKRRWHAARAWLQTFIESGGIEHGGDGRP